MVDDGVGVGVGVGVKCGSAQGLHFVVQLDVGVDVLVAALVDRVHLQRPANHTHKQCPQPSQHTADMARTG